jgi:FtsH-binding integral membrane protein
MDDFQSRLPPKRNPLTHRLHQREVLLQVTLPLAIGLTALLVLAVLASISGPESASLFADVSLIWLIIPVMVVSLIFLVLLAALAYGVIWLVGALPGFAYQVQGFFTLVATKSKQVGDVIVEPILRVQSLAASLRMLGRSLRRS